MLWYSDFNFVNRSKADLFAECIFGHPLEVPFPQSLQQDRKGSLAFLSLLSKGLFDPSSVGGVPVPDCCTRKVTTVSPLGSFWAATAPFLAVAWLIARMISCGVLFARSAGIPLALTTISLFTRGGTIFDGVMCCVWEG